MILFKKRKLARLAELEAKIKYLKHYKLNGLQMTSSGFSDYLECIGEIAKLKTLLGLREDIYG